MSGPPTALEPLDPAVVEALRRPEAHPHDRSARHGVEWVQTHLSHVFLTRERVAKLRKAVDLPFVHFGTRAQRNADCLREVGLNRRLAPNVYLGVAAIEIDPGGIRVGAPAEALAGAGEHCVVMRRLPAGRDALSLLERGHLGPPELDRVAEAVARFHERHGLGRPAPFSTEGWRDRCTRPVEETFALLAEAPGGLLDEALLERARERARGFATHFAARFEARRHAGRAVDGHGDLHLAHVWFESDDAEPIFVDCLEFDEALRCIDAAAEVAFLAMDLRYRGAPALAARFLRRYARASDDFDLFGVLDYFVAYRAGVRAKVASLAAADAAIGPDQRAAATRSARRHLELAAAALDAPGAGGLVLVAGAVGSGKTSAAEALADVVGGVVISSDRVRKRLAGIAALDHSLAGPDGIYDAGWTQRTYAGLVERARPVVASGRVAILDATFATRAQRRQAREAAGGLGVPLRLVETRCDPDLARARLARRTAEGRDASDAGPERLAASLAAFEPIAAAEEIEAVVVDTERPGWEAALARRAEGWGWPTLAAMPSGRGPESGGGPPPGGA